MKFYYDFVEISTKFRRNFRCALVVRKFSPKFRKTQEKGAKFREKKSSKKGRNFAKKIAKYRPTPTPCSPAAQPPAAPESRTQRPQPAAPRVVFPAAEGPIKTNARPYPTTPHRVESKGGSRRTACCHLFRACCLLSSARRSFITDAIIIG